MPSNDPSWKLGNVFTRNSSIFSSVPKVFDALTMAVVKAWDRQA
jgi:hypothetical protein